MAVDDDPELRRRFAAQRREELEAAPSFGRVWAAARAKRRPRRRLRLVVAAVALALAALLWLRPDQGPAPEPRTALPIAEWKSPTEFLLATPGRELLSTVPALGGPAMLDLGPPVPPPKPSSLPKGERS